MVAFFQRLWQIILHFFRRKQKPVKQGPCAQEEDKMAEPDENHVAEKQKEETSKQNSMITEHKEQANKNSINGYTSEFNYLSDLVNYRIHKSFTSNGDAYPNANGNETRGFNAEPQMPELVHWRKHLREFVEEHCLDFEEKILLLVALAPYIYPELFDVAISKALKEAGAEKCNGIGGVLTGRNCPYFLPTGETVIFLVNGADRAKRFEVQELFGAEHLFWEKKILWLEYLQEAEPPMHGKVIMSLDYVHRLTVGTHQSPQFSITFPAKKIAPLKEEKGDLPQRKAPEFSDLVITEDIMDQIKELKNWLKYNEKLMQEYGMKNKLKKGYRTLFYGPPGTGKTYTAEILGNDLKKDVYKIDLSMVVSKYIGETEKNLELLFARAEDKGWILFFDEADALFGKRTNVRDAHDKFANQEVSYLLQRIEDYNGLVILATNMKNNIDEAFIRRFNSILKFPFPDQAQRALIWEKSLPEEAIFKRKVVSGQPAEIKEEEVNIPEAVKKYELTGGNIINVVHYASIKAVEALYEKAEVQQKEKIPEMHQVCTGATGELPAAEDRPKKNKVPKLTIYLHDVLDGIRKEMLKEGKPFTS